MNERKAGLKKMLDRFNREIWLRGSRIIHEEDYNKLIIEDMRKASLLGNQIKIGKTLLSTHAECEHVFIIGKPGVGKTVLLYQIIEQILSSGRKSLIYDFKGDFISKFYRQDRDLIFNPVDSRSVRWNVIREIEGPGFPDIKKKASIDSLCHSLIPSVLGEDSGNEGFFRDGAREVLKSLITYLINNFEPGSRNNRGLISLLKKNDSEMLEIVRSVNPIASNYISLPGSNQSAGVLAVLSRYAGSLQCMDYDDSDFTVYNWLSDPKEGALFISGYADVRDMLRPMLSLMIDTMAKNILSGPDSLSKRIFFILDEFATLQRLNSLVELLTLSRSKGVSTWLVTQDLSQVENLYGRLKNSILNSCGTKVIFAVADPVDASYFSDFIGEAEYLIETAQESGVQRSEQGGLSDYDGRNINYSRQFVIKKVALPSNIMNQKKFHFIMRPYPYSFVRSEVEIRHYNDRNKSLVAAL